MPEALEEQKIKPLRPLGSDSDNPIDDLMANLIEETYFKSPYVTDTYLAPYNPDDLYQKHWDYSIYEKMLQDDQISVCMQLKKDLVLGDGFLIQPQSEDQDELADFLKSCLMDRYEGDFVEDLEEILTAYDFGFSLTEKVFKVEEEMLALKNLVTRHPASWLIHTDPKGKISKFEQRTSAGDLEIKPTSLIHMINSKRFQNPYGYSDMRAAYNAWFTKLHIVRYLSIFLEKAASPIPVGRYDKNAPEGTGDRLLNILKKFQSKTALAIPKDLEIEFLEAKNTGEAYRNSIHMFNMFIGRALFIPDLLGFTGSETGGGSFSLGKEQINIFFLHIQRRRNSLENLIQKEIINPIIKYNFGNVENPPQFKFKPLDDLRALEFAKLWLEAVKGKFYEVTDEEINHFRKLVKFPEGEIIRPEAVNPNAPLDPNDPELEQKEVEEKDDKEEKPEQKEEEEKKEFAKAFDQTPGDYHKKVNFKAIKTKLDDYDTSLMNEVAPVVRKMLLDLNDQIEKKKIIQNQNVGRIDDLSLKYKKELKQIIKNSFFGLYKDSAAQAQTEIQKSDYAKKPLAEDKFLEVLDAEVFNFIGDYEYAILKRTRVELIAAIKDGKPLSSVIGVLSDELKPLADVALERYARTKHTEVMNNGRKEFFDSTGVVSGYQYSAIMDERTSEICSGLHGKFFKAGDEPVPPMHFNCRSTLIPITKYEAFKPTETIRGVSAEKFIEDNKGQGFSKYTAVLEKEIEQPKISDPNVEIETIIDGLVETTKYSLFGKVFHETTIEYKDDEKKEIKKLSHKNIKYE